MMISIFHLLENDLCLVLFADCLLPVFPFAFSFVDIATSITDDFISFRIYWRSADTLFIHLVIRLSRLKATSNHKIVKDELSVKFHQLSLSLDKS